MWRKGLLSTLMILLLAACDSGEPLLDSSVPATLSERAASAPVLAAPALLAERYKDQALQVLDASEIELDGASVISLSFSVPLQAEQNLKYLVIEYWHIED